MPIYQIDGMTPVVPDESYVHPTAVLIGDVILGKGVYVGPNASLRGDFGRRGQDWGKQHRRRFGLCESQRRNARQPSDCRQSGKSHPYIKRTGAGLEEAGDAGVSDAGGALQTDAASGGTAQRSRAGQKAAGV